MITSELLTNVFYLYKGKGATKIPIFGSEKSNTALAIANIKKDKWARDTKVSWASNFSYSFPDEVGTVATTGTTTLTGTGTFFTDYNVGDKITVSGETVRTIDAIASDTSLTVTVAFTNTASSLTFKRSVIVKTGVQEYSLNRNFHVPSDQVIVESTNNTYLSTTKPQDRDYADVYFAGRNPKKIVFYNDVDNMNIVGGELKVPAYYIPTNLVAASDVVPVDDPHWLEYETAAELARNDPTKDDQFGNLQGIANDLYTQMIQANSALGFQQYNTVRNLMPVIGSESEE